MHARGELEVRYHIHTADAGTMCGQCVIAFDALELATVRWYVRHASELPLVTLVL
jgi:hypothetical protein